MASCPWRAKIPLCLAPSLGAPQTQHLALQGRLGRDSTSTGWLCPSAQVAPLHPAGARVALCPEPPLLMHPRASCPPRSAGQPAVPSTLARCRRCLCALKHLCPVSWYLWLGLLPPYFVDLFIFYF